MNALKTSLIGIMIPLSQPIFSNQHMISDITLPTDPIRLSALPRSYSLSARHGASFTRRSRTEKEKVSRRASLQSTILPTGDIDSLLVDILE